MLERALHQVIESRNLLETFGTLSNEFRGLRSMIGSLEDMHQGQVGLGEIFDVAAEFKGNIREFLRTMTLALDRAKKTKAGQDDNGVALRTFFRAKGLQWHTVILITSNEGVIPYQNAPLEDERRLFYVGMTRASSNLLISYVNNVCNNMVRPSQFIVQAGLW
jgi:superfamily I DNA/RNA helicase